MSKCIVLVIFVDLAYSEHAETEMLAVFTYADEPGFEPGLNSPEMLSQMARWVLANDKEAMESLKIILFKDCRNSRSEFFEMRRKESSPNNKPIMYSCCECHYEECHHYDNMSYLPKKANSTTKTCVLHAF